MSCGLESSLMGTLVCEWRPEIAGTEMQALELRWPPGVLERLRRTLEGWLAKQFSFSSLPILQAPQSLSPPTTSAIPSPNPRLPSP